MKVKVLGVGVAVTECVHLGVGIWIGVGVDVGVGVCVGLCVGVCVGSNSQRQT